MSKQKIDLVAKLYATSWETNKTRGHIPALYKRLDADFSALKGVLSKGIFLGLSIGIKSLDINRAGNRLIYEVNLIDKNYYTRYLQDYISMVRSLAIHNRIDELDSRYYDIILDFGEIELVPICRLLYNLGLESYIPYKYIASEKNIREIKQSYYSHK